MIAHHGPNPYPGATTDIDATRQMCSRAKMSAIFDNTVMIYTRRRVNNDIFANSCSGVNDHTCRNDRPTSNSNIVREDSFWVDRGGQ